MTRFGDLMKGIPVEVPTVEKKVEPPVEETIEESSSDFDSMSKEELEDYGRTIGIELDRRLSKKKLIKQLEEHKQYIDSV